MALLRDGPQGLETFVLRRAAGMAFAARMHVFPGGRVDPLDDEPVPWAGPSARDWAAMLGTSEPSARALVVAAVRETFEESGVLLASPPAARPLADADRVAVETRAGSLGELLRRHGLRLGSDLLRPWSRWITPEFEERRYDTWFFLAGLPDGAVARQVPGEADRAAWLPVTAALAAHGRGELTMLPPTAATLRDLADTGSVAAALAISREALSPVLPRPVVTDGGVRLVLPGAAGYPA